jgi:transposase InsO family protein
VFEERRRGRRLYGARKVWRQLQRDGPEVGRCRVERLMRTNGLVGARRDKRSRPPGPIPLRPPGGPGATHVPGVAPE